MTECPKFLPLASLASSNKSSQTSSTHFNSGEHLHYASARALAGACCCLRGSSRPPREEALSEMNAECRCAITRLQRGVLCRAECGFRKRRTASISRCWKHIMFKLVYSHFLCRIICCFILSAFRFSRVFVDICTFVEITTNISETQITYRSVFII